MGRQKMVALRPEQYDELNSVKQETEQRVGTHFDWGSFLAGVFAGGVLTAIVMEIINERRDEREGVKKDAV